DFEGNHSHYDTGSYMRLNGVNFLLGLARRFTSDTTATTTSGFVEAGDGGYSTYNRFNTGRFRASDNRHYYGVAAPVRHEWLRGDLTGLYVQAALHVGHVQGDWHSHDMYNSGGKVSYETSSTYYGLHAGLGYKMTLDDDLWLIIYNKYYWTYIGSDHATLAGDRFHFKSVNSNLNQLGARLGKKLTGGLDGYVGAAWNHEFSGTARATVYG